jgi:hypothetical protein
MKLEGSMQSHHRTQNSTPIKVDRNDPDQKTLSGYGNRIATLLGKRRVQSSPHMIAALDDFLGALFALLFARQGKFVDRTRQPIEVDAIERRAMQLADAAIKSEGPWLAGFHFNSAIYRIASAYHRVLKVVTGDPETGGRVKDLRPAAEKLFSVWTKQSWSHDDLDKVLGQVNDLKHRHGVFYRRTVKYSQAINATKELLTVV